ncbi:carbohydrate kinase [Oceanobacillus neutriphilus]|uniref:Carbohydrate kinase n=1 Tax=Oceanobacillus neutriphilus TaxID=531815 RepID=A0ABQ2NWU4_9BACI|nr:carbohydrate kinase [Oceanobacillus neutriphilus]GGP12604.1 carbohydrate kinase [Oceanobacillus neutriphilus]
MEKEILKYIRQNPFISQQELAEKVGLSRSATAGYISNLSKKGEIKGRAYILKEKDSITCIGTMNYDSKVHAKEELQIGTANPVKKSESCGGVARNISENLARLGVSVSLVSCVGNDKEGMWVMEETKLSGVDTSLVKVLPDVRTGAYTAVLDTEGDMYIALADLDINNYITPKMIEENWSHIIATESVFIDTNISRESLSFIIERCRNEKIKLYLDPVSLSDAEKLPNDLSGIDTIFPNCKEAEFLSGITNIRSVEDCKRAAELIKEKGVTNVIITLGGKGVFYSVTGEEQMMSGSKLKVVDTTGAGDAFAAGYIYGVIQGFPPKKACELGMKSSQLTLQTTKSVYPNLRTELLEN